MRPDKAARGIINRKNPPPCLSGYAFGIYPQPGDRLVPMTESMTRKRILVVDGKTALRTQAFDRLRRALEVVTPTILDCAASVDAMALRMREAKIGIDLGEGDDHSVEITTHEDNGQARYVHCRMPNGE